MAAKIMKVDDNEKIPQLAITEAIYGQKLNHPNIMKNYGFGKGTLDFENNNGQETVAFNLLEFVENGEILDFVQMTGKFSEPTCRYFFK